MKAIRKILVAVDFSEYSDRALDAAISFAKQFGAEIEVVHAYELPVPLVTPYEVAVPDPFLSETRAAAASKLEEATERVRAAGLTARSHLGEVPAAAAIVREATETGADLIVMGTRGNTGLKHAILGSVAERTLRNAPCSILTVKTDD